MRPKSLLFLACYPAPTAIHAASESDLGLTPSSPSFLSGGIRHPPPRHRPVVSQRRASPRTQMMQPSLLACHPPVSFDFAAVYRRATQFVTIFGSSTCVDTLSPLGIHRPPLANRQSVNPRGVPTTNGDNARSTTERVRA